MKEKVSRSVKFVIVNDGNDIGKVSNIQEAREIKRTTKNGIIYQIVDGDRIPVYERPK